MTSWIEATSSVTGKKLYLNLDAAQWVEATPEGGTLVAFAKETFLLRGKVKREFGGYLTYKEEGIAEARL